MPRPLGSAAGERMELDPYFADFGRDYASAREFWKLERGQSYAEPGEPDWQAFNRGDWAESMRLMEADREELAGLSQEDKARGMIARRVRIVALPLTPYIHWELYALRIRDGLCESIRVLLDTEIADLEDQGPLPDIYTIDRRVMYQAVYNDDGVLENALKYTDGELVSQCRDFIVGLYDRGEPLGSFFEREIAHLPPPRRAEPALPVDYLERKGLSHPVPF